MRCDADGPRRPQGDHRDRRRPLDIRSTRWITLFGIASAAIAVPSSSERASSALRGLRVDVREGGGRKSCSIGARERPRRRRGRRAAGPAANRSSRCAPSRSKPLQWGLLRLLPHTRTARVHVIGPPDPSLLTWTVHLRVCSQSSVATHKGHFRLRHFGTTFTSWYNFPAPAAGRGMPSFFASRLDSGSSPGRAESQLASELGELPLLGHPTTAVALPTHVAAATSGLHAARAAHPSRRRLTRAAATLARSATAATAATADLVATCAARVQPDRRRVRRCARRHHSCRHHLSPAMLYTSVTVHAPPAARIASRALSLGAGCCPVCGRVAQ